MAKEFKRYLVTSALPYANGPVHIGHLAGVYIPSDIYTRYLRLKGCDVISVCGSDEHGVPITIKARKEGVTPQQIVDRYHNLIKKSFEGLGMSFDIYSRTSSATHAATASEFFRKLYDEGKFIEKTTMQYYDEEAQTFLADRYIVGTCPKCGNDRAYGDQCEKCGSTLSPDELIDPHSAVSGSVPVKRETKHWYLPLDQYEGFLREWILDGHKEWKTNVYGQCKSWLDGGLQPRAVSRDLDWGIPVPVEGAEGKVLYVWFDAPIGYISATKDLTPDWEKYWKSEDTKMVHFIGKDNIGQNAALYSYNDETGKLVFQDISAVDRDGNVIFNIKCGGRYFIALGSEVAPPAYLCGDVNGDGVVNAHDAAAILKYATYGYPLDKRCGDTNADGAVDAHDALPILNYVVGNVKLLPAVGFRQ